MMLRNWMSAKAVICVQFGLAIVFVPVAMLSLYGMSADSAAISMTRSFG